jgi:hypothetical protein
MPLKREELITLHTFGQTLPGDDRCAAQEKNLCTADLLLLLLSPDFIACEKCFALMNRALQRQEKDGVQVIALWLRPVDWKIASLNCLQAFPTNGKSVTLWPDRDEVCRDIARGIRTIVCAQLHPGANHQRVTENSLPYLHWLIKRVTFLDTAGIPRIPGFSAPRLEEVYIPLQARYADGRQLRGSVPCTPALPTKAEEKDQAQSSPLAHVLARHDHLVLPGEPGSGKTTFLRYLALKHARPGAIT